MLIFEFVSYVSNGYFDSIRIDLLWYDPSVLYDTPIQLFSTHDFLTLYRRAVGEYLFDKLRSLGLPQKHLVCFKVLSYYTTSNIHSFKDKQYLKWKISCVLVVTLESVALNLICKGKLCNGSWFNGTNVIFLQKNDSINDNNVKF